jgi:hypothetical protein
MDESGQLFGASWAFQTCCYNSSKDKPRSQASKLARLFAEAKRRNPLALDPRHKPRGL